MNAPNAGTIFSRSLQTGILIVSLACCIAGADTKKPAPAPAPKTAARPAGAPAKPAGGAAAHGPTTAGGAHGPTTAGASHGPTTAGASHGPTTAGASHGPTTAGTSHSPTTAGTTHSPTTAGARTTPASHQPAGTNTAHTENRPGSSAPGQVSHTQAMKGTTANPRPVPSTQKVITTKTGNEVRMRPGGKPADVHVAARGMDIHHSLNGTRRVEVVRADHTRIVAEHGGRGYVQHPYLYGGREYGHRTYYYGGRAYDRYYYGYPYHGVYVNMYSPASYYQPAFYGWAYNPWVSPISYGWGWNAAPWYGYYGGYFSPYAVYPSASFWLTDYLISNSLAAAYQARADQAAAAQAEGAVALTAETKDLISAEVQRQISVENAEAQAQNAAPNPNLSGVQSMLGDNVKHVFVAGATLDVVDSTGAECEVSEGDALQLTGPTPADATAASLAVLSTKGGKECRAGAVVNVAVADLQEMQNHMRETIDQGMSDLKAKGGQGGLPAVPVAAKADAAKAPFAASAPGPDPQAATLIAQQTQEADQAEKQVLNEAQVSGPGPSGNGDSAPASASSLAPGQTVSEVTGMLGAPVNQIKFGAKQIYVYKDVKVTFVDGKVTDIQ